MFLLYQESHRDSHASSCFSATHVRVRGCRSTSCLPVPPPRCCKRWSPFLCRAQAFPDFSCALAEYVQEFLCFVLHFSVSFPSGYIRARCWPLNRRSSTSAIDPISPTRIYFPDIRTKVCGRTCARRLCLPRNGPARAHGISEVYLFTGSPIERTRFASGPWLS